NLDRLAIWERDSDVKIKVRTATASLNNSYAETRQEPRFPKREGTCNCCGKSGHWVKDCRKKQQDSRRNLQHNPSPTQPAYNPEVVHPLYSETLGQLAQACTNLVLGQTIKVRCPNSVSTSKNQAKITSSCWGNWLTTLSALNLVLDHAPVTNPSSCVRSAMTDVPLEDEEMTNDCVMLTHSSSNAIAETPLNNADF
ncbi:MAG: hypothetical protein ACRCVL_07405, partial [Cetobacterium sp.]